MVFETQKNDEVILKSVSEKVLIYFSLFRNVFFTGIFAHVIASYEISNLFVISPFQMCIVVSFAATVKALNGFKSVSLAIE